MKLPFFILFFTLILPPSLGEEMPSSPAGGGYLDLRGGKQGYYYAEDRGDCFDKLLRDGMTIEFWFCPARVTKQGEWWNLVTKPAQLRPWFTPIYQLRIEYFREHDGNEWMWLRRSIGGGGASWGLWWITPQGEYEPKWHHVILQGRAVGNGFYGYVFLDGVSKGHFGSSSMHFTFDSDLPLFVGGLPPGAQVFIHLGGLDGVDGIRSEGITFDGLIDELRISKIERYKPKPYGERIFIRKRLQPDEHTVALWHFDEGPRALKYQDASGNGHTLFAAGQLDVPHEGKTPVLWGDIKASHQR
jgi:hypothetical protein